MAAPRGNQYWKIRSSHGRKPIFASPDALGTACEEYFEWVQRHPIMETQLFSYKGDVTKAKLPKMRPMTVSGLCIFLDISQQAWSEYKQREGFGEITTRVEEIIYVYKFDGAAAGLLNGNIIARELGLKDEQKTTVEAGDSIMSLMQAIDGRTRSK